MEVPTPVLVVIGAVLAALLTGLFNLTNLIVSKEDKVSDFRQKWLDSLREETSRLLAVIETLVRLVEPKVVGKLAGLSGAELDNFRKENSQQYRDLNEMQFRVLLRLNPAEHKVLEARLNALTSAFYGPCNNLAEITRLQGDVIQETQRIIKDTWERVKQGEKTFRRMRKGLMIAVLFLFAIAVILLVSPHFRLLSSGQQPPTPPKDATKQQTPGLPPSPAGGKSGPK